MSRWTDEERAQLRGLWDRGATRETLCRALPRHPWSGIVHEAERQGLPLVPPGWVTVAEGARRAGYSAPAWKRLLRQLDVRTRPHPRLKHPAARSPRGHRIHSWTAAEAALCRHLQAGETLEQAAARLEVRPATLYRHAARAGLYNLAQRGAPVRHPRDAWTRALPWRQASGPTETAAEAAARLEVTPRRLRQQARAAGLTGVDRAHRAVRLAPEAWDALRRRAA